MMVATFSTRSSSNAAERRMGMGNEVAMLKGDEKETPGEPATPWRASLHQLYAGSPRRDTPGDLLG
jgi:hypothetical protein